MRDRKLGAPTVGIVRVGALGVAAILHWAVASAAPAVAQSADRPAFARASAVFGRLPVLDRNEICLELMATGDFDGIASGQLSDRLYGAIASFQDRHGLDATGVPTPETRAALSEFGGRIFNNWGFEFLDHPTAAAGLAVPGGFGLVRTATPHGYDLTNRTRTMSIDFSFFGDREAQLDQVFQNLTRPSPGRQIDYEVLRPTFFAVYGSTGGRPFSARYIVVPGGIAGFTLSWNRDAFPKAGRIATIMANELYPHRMLEGGGKAPGLAEAMPIDRAPDEDPRPGSGALDTPLNAGADAESQAALQKMQADRVERDNMVRDANDAVVRAKQIRDLEAANQRAAIETARRQQQEERLGRAIAAATPDLEDAKRFVKENAADPQMVGLLHAIDALHTALQGRDPGAIEDRRASLDAALRADPIFVADAERRAIQKQHDDACSLADARRTLRVQRAVLIETVRRDPTGVDAGRLLALAERVKALATDASLDVAQTLVGTIDAVIEGSGLRATFALAKAEAEHAPAPADLTIDPTCPH